MVSAGVLSALNADPTVRRRLRFADSIFRIEVGDTHWNLALRDGAVAIADPGTASDVLVRIKPEAWAEFQKPVPPPGCHDIYAMAETGRAEVTGDFLAMFRYSFVLKDILQQLATARMYG